MLELLLLLLRVDVMTDSCRDETDSEVAANLACTCRSMATEGDPVNEVIWGLDIWDEEVVEVEMDGSADVVRLEVSLLEDASS